MKEILKNIHRPARLTLIIGWVMIAVIITASTVLYIGAGGWFDYYSAVGLSEKLLAAARPVSVGVFAVSTGIEYCSKRKKNSSN